MFANHWWENRYADPTPIDTVKRKLREWGWRVRLDLCWDEHDGFDVGAYVGDWKPACGPFLFHRQMEDFENTEGEWVNLGPWRLMVALHPDAFRGFDEGAIK